MNYILLTVISFETKYYNVKTYDSWQLYIGKRKNEKGKMGKLKNLFKVNEHINK